MSGEDPKAEAARGQEDAREPACVFVPLVAFRAFIDAVQLRDPAGRSRRPHLVPARVGDSAGFLARGPFVIHFRYAVGKTGGETFCRATRDENTIHTLADIVPGAYTAARVLLPIEVLFPELDISRMTVRFTAVAGYGRSLAARIRCEPGPAGARFIATTSEAGGAGLAEIEVEARRLCAGRTAPEIPRRKVNVERLRAVCAFLRSLGVAPHGYFRDRTPGAYCYPKSFLASLPSGAMVRQLRGEGGLLNKLSLEFGEAPVPITSRDDPTVEIERPKARRTFNKILAAITDGLRTYVRGSALVLSRGGGALPEETPSPPALPPLAGDPLLPAPAR